MRDNSEANALGCMAALIGLFVSMPLWYYVLYQILVRVNATQPMWIAFWAYVPASVIFQLLEMTTRAVRGIEG